MLDAIFALSADVRYVAWTRGSRLEMRARAGLRDASAAESDRYEELLVNPTVLKLLTQRGEIDCGGLRYVIVRYGNFFQVVMPLSDGHVSVAVEPHGDPLAVAAAIDALLRRDAAERGREAAAGGRAPGS